MTPDFPNGTYAYFVSIASNGTPTFPYNIGRAYYGSATGSSVTSIGESVITNVVAGPNASFSLNPPAVQGSTVTLTWSSVDGGTYQVESTADLNNWTTNITGLASQGVSTQTNLNSIGTMGFYCVARTALASYDPVSAGSAGGGQTITLTPDSGNNGELNLSITAVISATANPAPPTHTGAKVQLFTIGSLSVTNTSYTYNSGSGAGTVNGTLSITNAPTGPQTVTITFSPPPGQQNGPTYTQTGGFTVNQ